MKFFINIFKKIKNIYIFKKNNNLINNSSEDMSSSEEYEFNTEDYILESYEKDLEKAIIKSLKQKTKCILCCNKMIDSAFIPCGHMICCFNCANKCDNLCPICRKKGNVQRIFLS